MTEIEKLTEKNKHLQETILALRRTIGEYIDKYEKGGNRQIKKI